MVTPNIQPSIHISASEMNTGAIKVISPPYTIFILLYYLFNLLYFIFRTSPWIQNSYYFPEKGSAVQDVQVIGVDHHYIMLAERMGI